MSPTLAKEVIDKIVAQTLGYENPYTLEQFCTKYAFDVRLPFKVADSTTGAETWAQSSNPVKFMTKDNIMKRSMIDDWEIPPRQINDIKDLLAAWAEVNYTTTERYLESINVSQSDNIYNSENIFRSQDCHFSKNLVFCDGVRRSEYVAASQRSDSIVYSARVEDSNSVSKSFGVSWSTKITNSLFIHDANNLTDCILCSHIASKQYCVANMQFDEAEYNRIKDIVVQWILS